MVGAVKGFDDEEAMSRSGIVVFNDVVDIHKLVEPSGGMVLFVFSESVSPPLAHLLRPANEWRRRLRHEYPSGVRPAR